MIANYLTLNLNKFNIFSIKFNEICRKISSDNYDTAFTKLSTVDYAKYLGVTLNNRLSFDIHINNLVKNCQGQSELLQK